MIGMITGSIQSYVSQNMSQHDISKKLYSRPEKKLFDQNQRSDIPQWLEQMKEQSERSADTSRIASISAKLDQGDDLTEEELSYLRKNSPELHSKAIAARYHKLCLKKKLLSCRNKEDVRRVGLAAATLTVSQIRGTKDSSGQGSVNTWIAAAVNKEYNSFFSTREYAKLPTEDEKDKHHFDKKA